MNGIIYIVEMPIEYCFNFLLIASSDEITHYTRCHLLPSSLVLWCTILFSQRPLNMWSDCDPKWCDSWVCVSGMLLCIDDKMHV